MADNIVDNRALIDDADVNAGSAPWWVDLGGGAVTEDDEIFIDGIGSMPGVCGSTRDGTFYEFATTQDYANNHIYIWVLCGVVGLLNAKASQGLTFRMYTTDPTTDYAEWDLAGSDSWPSAVQGGWTLFCIDLESTPSRTSGTAPVTSAILGFGISFQTPTMPRMVSNIWMDAMYSLADGVPAVIVEGQNGGSTPWTWADLPAELGVASGAAQLGPGGSIVLNGPVEFFADDAADHVFLSTNELVLWNEHEFIASDLYGITILGAASGTADFTMGIKSGTGDDATGSQGGAIQAAAASVRWFWDSDIANIDSVNMYGVQLIHGSDFLLDTSANSWISCAWIDCTSALVSNAGDVLRCSIIDANTADGVAFMTTDDLTDIVFSTFTFSDGHAVELTTPQDLTQTSKGNVFDGYGAIGTNDAAIYNNTGSGLVVIDVTESGAGTTYRNGASASTQVNSSVSVSIAGLTWGTPVKLIARETLGSVTAGDTLTSGFADENGEFPYSHNDEGSLDISVVARNQGVCVAAIAENNPAFVDETNEAHSNTTADMTLLPAVPDVDDAYYFGHDEQFTQMKLDISTALTQSAAPDIFWEYWNGSIWTALSGLVDDTNTLETAGENKISWTLPGNWAVQTVNSQGPLYYVRFRVDAVGTITQVPVGRRASLDVTRYFPYDENREIVTGTGLADNASWTEDKISTF